MSSTKITFDALQSTGLGGGRLGVADIVFFVVSAAAPLTVVISAAPLGFRLGGIGAPGAMLFCGIVLILFALGFTAMSRYVRNVGAFYAYAARGLGKPAGVGVAMVTLLAYVFLTMAFYAFIGFFGALTLGNLFGLTAPWWVCSLAAMAVVGFLGRRQVEVGARVLGVLLTLEVSLLLVLSVAVLIQGGPEPISLAGFAPGNVLFANGTATLLVPGFGAYVGFEGTAIYAEEAKDPGRTVPRATYAAIGLLAVLYAFTFWVLTVAFGAEGILAMAQTDAFQDLVFTAGAQYLGAWVATVMQVLIVTSFFACVLAFHNAASRYVFSLGRERLLPHRLGLTDPVSGAPRPASTVMSAISLVMVLLAALAGLDPYLQFGLWTYAAGVAGLVFAQAATAIAVLGFFGRDRRGENPVRVLVAPALGAAGLLLGFTLIVTNFEVVTGQTGVTNWLLLLPTPVLFVAGTLIGLQMRRNSPAHYAALVADAEQDSAI